MQLEVSLQRGFIYIEHKPFGRPCLGVTHSFMSSEVFCLSVKSNLLPTSLHQVYVSISGEGGGGVLLLWICLKDIAILSLLYQFT
jgi:hypothetical protein